MVARSLDVDARVMPRRKGRITVLANRPFRRDPSAVSKNAIHSKRLTDGPGTGSAPHRGSKPTPRRRPLLLGLVFGVFLILVAITTTAQAIVATTHFSTQTLNGTIARDRTLVRIFVDGNLEPSDLTIGGDPARADLLQRQLAAYVERGEILRVELRALDGLVLLSNDTAMRGSIAPTSPGFERALAGKISAEIVSGPSLHAGDEALPSDAVMEEYVPLVTADGKVQAVFGIWRDAEPILAALTGIRNDSIAVTLGAASVLALILFITFRAANARIARQTVELVEATRSDPLTGLLNHGALVAVLTGTVDEARIAESSVGIALVDIDNFRLLNDTYGHGAGDATLLDLADRLVRAVPAGTTVGRYGPDEFLIVTPGAPQDVAAVVEQLRSDLSNVTLQFGQSSGCPSRSVRASAATRHAVAVTELLASATLALREAKSSGGDRVVEASVEGENGRVAGSFDVLQGLVIAVDTKDRYTKRHSEDVARYALFLAELLGLDEEFLRTLKIAGLLHDVGKIGIPDEILRKPGKLTDGEYADRETARQARRPDRARPAQHRHRPCRHPAPPRALGRGRLPAWTRRHRDPAGRRILSVADAFSAMTTSRPYRKALSVLEGLRRLEDASDTQLEGRLVTVFINGIETAKDPPLPEWPSRRGCGRH